MNVYYCKRLYLSYPMEIQKDQISVYIAVYVLYIADCCLKYGAPFMTMICL